MASTSRSIYSLLILTTGLMTLLPSPALSLTCTPNPNFTNCDNLPSLNATLHWNYDPASSPSPTLTVLFSAQPPSPNGWVAWALNPTSTGMVGAQALIAFHDPKNGSVVVKTYNITSYGGIAESEIAYGVLSKSGEYSGGVMSISATLELPRGGSSSNGLNQVWQVGSQVGSDGVPVKHAFNPENLQAKGLLSLGPAGNGGSPAPAPTGGEGSGGVGLMMRLKFSWVYGVLLCGGIWVLLV